ncbi:PTS system mannose/fructose/sorbose family transporter subunit IID [Desulfonatronovibrio magnus]|uniref:PTS system mannose/fructose/sorbose family transporter subunit IID n=1 Tax=Desulfonatronovibrio magnus TaxID=698827 RepID=UPI0005EB5295|nr:PTS system mannose/fructose/sorbose family transporter subunit IID [Desulfonatronovibrio magnus]
MLPVSLKALVTCFFRSYLTAAAFNTKGMQNIGLAYALDAGLQEIYKEHGKLQKARRRHLKLYNTHPMWNPLLIGLFLSLEQKISHNVFPSQSMPKVKSTLVFTLSAIGDSFFSGSLLITWSLITLILLMSGLYFPAIIFGTVFFLSLHLFKVYTFYMGLTRGLVFINDLKRWNLINQGSRLKVLNSLLAVAFGLVIWPFSWHYIHFILVFAAGLILTFLYRRLIWIREVLLASVLGLCLIAPEFPFWLHDFLQQHLTW